jgi:hypothetical protein
MLLSLRLRRCLMTALLILVPIQGMGSVVHALTCVAEGEHATVSHDHAQADHDHGGGAPQSGHSGGGTASDHGADGCCHHFTSAAAPLFPRESSVDLPVFQSSITLLKTLFFPEQPQRPPRV